MDIFSHSKSSKVSSFENPTKVSSFEILPKYRHSKILLKYRHSEFISESRRRPFGIFFNVGFLSSRALDLMIAVSRLFKRYKTYSLAGVL